MNATISEAGTRRDKTDRQLLDRFVVAGDQSAFAELVARHGACVWAVCRRVLGQEQDAEDAFQAVFLILGRKAGAIRKRESVGSWLHGVAYHTATKVRRAVARRHAREQHAGGAAPESPPPDQAAMRELQHLLDEEVARLAEKHRTPFVLCCLEGLTRVEAAQELGWNEGTVSSRLAQARALLQNRLAQRGFTLSAVLTACALAQGTATAAPLTLVQAAVQAGVAGNAAAAFSPSAVALADGIVHALMVIKLKTAVAASLLLAMVTTAAGVAAYQFRPAAEESAPIVQKKPAPPAPPPDVSDVWSAAISPNGKLAAAGAGRWDRPGEVGVWDLESRKLLWHAVEKKGVASVAFSPDSKLLAWGNCTAEVRLAEAPLGKEVAVFKIPWVSRVAFSPDGSLLAAASEAKIVRLIDVASRKVVCDLQGDLLRFHNVAFSPDGKRIVAGGGDWKPGGVCQVTIWDVESRKQVGKLIGHELAVLCIAFAPDGKTIATGAVDKTIRLWNADTGVEIKVLRGHVDKVECVTFSLDGKTLFSGGVDGTMRLWDVERGEETAKVGGGPSESAFAPAKAGDDGPGTGLAAPWGFPRSVRAIRFTPDGAKLLVGGGPRTLRLFDAVTLKETATLWESPPPQAPVIIAPPGAVQKDGDPAKGEEKPKPLPREWPERVDIQFNKGLEAYPDLRFYGPDAAAMAKVEPQGLRVTLPIERGDTGDLGVELRKIMRGDFEITLAYELLALPDPAPQWGAGVIFDARFDTPDDAMANITRTRKTQTAYFGSSYFAIGDNGRLTRQSLNYPRANDKVRTGRLRLERLGTTLAFQVDEGGGFRTIATKEVAAADVVSMRAMVTTTGKPFPVDIRFANLELRWDPGTRIAVAPVEGKVLAGQGSRGWLVAAAIIGVLVMLSIVATLFLVRRRRPGAGKEPPAEMPRKKSAPIDTMRPLVALQCPDCQRKLKVKAELAGKKVKCPHCATAIEVPSLEAGLPTPKGPRSPEASAES